MIRWMLEQYLSLILRPARRWMLEQYRAVDLATGASMPNRRDEQENERPPTGEAFASGTRLSPLGSGQPNQCYCSTTTRKREAPQNCAGFVILRFPVNDSLSRFSTVA